MSPPDAAPTQAAPTRALTVYLADDHPIILAGVKALVTAAPGLEVIGEAADGRTTLKEVGELNPDLLILDISMPGLNGMQVAQALRSSHPDIRILILTVHEDRGYIRQLLDLGVAGYLLKRSASEDLVRAINAIAAGGVYLDPAIAGVAVGAAALDAPDGRTGGGDLSQREAEVVRMTASGHSNKSMAAELGISVKSAETYKARAMEKLGFHTRVQLVRYAVGKGWLTG